MKREKKRFHFLAGAVIMSAYLITSDLTIAHAGDINANEQAIVNEVSGVFEYEGKKYRAYDSYIDLAKQYLAMDEYDLTKEQCDQVIAKVRANVATGIADGYLYEVTEDKTGTESQTGGNAANTEENTDSKEQDTPESTENIPKKENTENTQESTEGPDGGKTETGQGTETGEGTATEQVPQTGEKEQYEDTLSELLTKTKEEASTESIIKNTGFSLKGTVVTGAALLTAFLINLILAAGISRGVKKNEQNS